MLKNIRITLGVFNLKIETSFQAKTIHSALIFSEVGECINLFASEDDKIKTYITQ